jgi:hypothetical protein
MSGKGATAYREQNNVPLVIKYPGGEAGATCDSLTSHLDLVPTILGCTGLEGVDAGDLPGHDITPVLSGGAAAGLHDVRDGALYAYNMFTLLDAAFLEAVATAKDTGEQPESPPQFDFSKRGAIRSVFDGRYRFSRYFAPTEHHRPETLEELMARNDLELFDLQVDPDEANNLAADPNSAASADGSAELLGLADGTLLADDGLPNGNAAARYCLANAVLERSEVMAERGGPVLVTVGAVLTIVGSLAPWVSSLGVSANSWDLRDLVLGLGFGDDGGFDLAVTLWALVPVLLGAAVLAAWLSRAVISAVCGVIGALYAGIVALAVLLAPDIELFTVEWGVPLTFVASLMVLASAVWQIVVR